MNRANRYQNSQSKRQEDRESPSTPPPPSKSRYEKQLPAFSTQKPNQQQQQPPPLVRGIYERKRRVVIPRPSGGTARQQDESPPPNKKFTSEEHELDDSNNGYDVVERFAVGHERQADSYDVVERFAVGHERQADRDVERESSVTMSPSMFESRHEHTNRRLETLMDQQVNALHSLNERLRWLEHNRAESRAQRRRGLSILSTDANPSNPSSRLDAESEASINSGATNPLTSRLHLEYLQSKVAHQQESIARLKNEIEFDSRRQQRESDYRRQLLREQAETSRRKHSCRRTALIVAATFGVMVLVAIAAIVAYKYARGRAKNEANPTVATSGPLQVPITAPIETKSMSPKTSLDLSLSTNYTNNTRASASSGVDATLSAATLQLLREHQRNDVRQAVEEALASLSSNFALNSSQYGNVVLGPH